MRISMYYVSLSKAKLDNNDEERYVLCGSDLITRILIFQIYETRGLGEENICLCVEIL